MGHVRIGFLPHTHQWNAIVNQLSSYDNDAATVAVIADRTLQAVRKEFDGLQYDESVIKAIEYLVFCLNHIDNLKETENMLKPC